jgi:hypothetical protein
MNKVDVANQAAFDLVTSLVVRLGLETSCLTRNVLFDLDVEDGDEASVFIGDTKERFFVSFMDNRTPQVNGPPSLGPVRYELSVRPRIVIASLGDEATGRSRRTAFFEALVDALQADDTLGGAVDIAEIAEEGEDDEDFEDGAEGRADIIQLELSVSGARTPRG